MQKGCVGMYTQIATLHSITLLFMLGLKFIKNEEQRVIKLTRAITLHTHSHTHTHTKRLLPKKQMDEVR